MSPKSYAVSWSGGKDCFLAFVTILNQLGLSHDQLLFITFVPQVGNFLCHPLGILEEQSRLLNITHEFIVIDEINWEASYLKALGQLKHEYGISHFVSGGVYMEELPQVDFWLRDILAELQLTLANPVTPRPAKYMLEILKQQQIVAKTTGMQLKFYHEKFLGQPISWELLEQTGLSQQQNFGWYGENGEYHTVVTQYQHHHFAPEFPATSATVQKGEVIALDIPAHFHELKSHQRRVT